MTATIHHGSRINRDNFRMVELASEAGYRRDKRDG